MIDAAMCLSGRDLIDRGFEIDVDLALQSEVSAVAPMLHRGVYSA